MLHDPLILPIYPCETPGRQKILMEQEQELSVYSLLLLLDECFPTYTCSVFMQMRLKMDLQQIEQGIVQAV